MPFRLIFKKPKEWSSRYLIPELAAILTALLGTNLAYVLDPAVTVVAVSFIAAWSENIGYYGVILCRDVTAERRANRGKPISVTFLMVSRNLLIEFGAAECIDSLILRPSCMYVAMYHLDSPSLATLLGKLTSDIGFYLIAVTGYEIRKKLFPQISSDR